MAERTGLTALALTDHDTTDGVPRLISAASNTSVEAVTGVELSAEFGNITLHILGYFFDPAHAGMREALEWVRSGRSERNSQILDSLNRLGYALTYDDVRKHSSDDLIGRPHFAAALIEKGHFKHKDQVFRQLLGKGKAAYVDRRRLEPEVCVELIRQAGGIASIAHPGQMKLSSRGLRRLVGRLKKVGLGGLEVWHPTHVPHQSLSYLRVCEDYQLLPTGGSDFHGALTPDLSLGRGFGDLEVPDTVLEPLRGVSLSA